MVKRRTLLMGLTATAAAPAVAGCVPKSAKARANGAQPSAATGHIEEATAITEVFGDGQKLTAVAVKYGKVVDGSKLSMSTFKVGGRTVTNVYSNTLPEKAGHGVNGTYVIIELSPADADAALYVQSGRSFTVKKASASLTQSGTVTTADGDKYAASGAAVKTSKVDNLIVDDFQQFEYRDSRTGQSLKCNLYVPKNYDKTKSYPMVLFLHDAGTVSKDPVTTLVQGLGAVVWASPTEQAKHESFVLAPQFTGTEEGSDGNTTALKAIKGLIDSVVGKYSIDRNRLYATGQSSGAMTSIALDFTYPDLFAASFPVAGQWDNLSQVKPLAKRKIWAVVSQGDEKAYPGMTGIMDTLAKEGAKIGRAVWNGQSTVSEFAAVAAEMRAKGTPVNFVALKKGTVVWPGLSDDSGSNHLCTWRAAYTIEGIRDWLFAQKK